MNSKIIEGEEKGNDLGLGNLINEMSSAHISDEPAPLVTYVHQILDLLSTVFEGLQPSSQNILRLLRKFGYKIDLYDKVEDSIDGLVATHYAFHLKNYDAHYAVQILYLSFDRNFSHIKALHYFAPFNGKYALAESGVHRAFKAFFQDKDARSLKQYQAYRDEGYQVHLNQNSYAVNCSCVKYL